MYTTISAVPSSVQRLRISSVTSIAARSAWSTSSGEREK
jgi:hypothetical protein